MKCTVVELFVWGVRRTSVEIKAATPIAGELTFERNSPNRSFSVAYLKQEGIGTGAYAGYTRDALTPLIHAELTGMNQNSLVIRGIQRRHEGDKMREEVQAWWVRF